MVDDWDRLRSILNVSLFDKAKTSSFHVRTGAEAMAIEVITETAGIGIGLGSHKPNSLTLTLLSNIGLVGTSAFLVFITMLLRPRDTKHLPGWRAISSDDTPLRFLVIGLVLVHAISNPNFNVVLFWSACGFLIGYHVSLARWPSRFENAGPEFAIGPGSRWQRSAFKRSQSGSPELS
jgi:hypothetical protein